MAEEKEDLSNFDINLKCLLNYEDDSETLKAKCVTLHVHIEKFLTLYKGRGEDNYNSYPRTKLTKMKDQVKSLHDRIPNGDLDVGNEEAPAKAFIRLCRKSQVYMQIGMSIEGREINVDYSEYKDKINELENLIRDVEPIILQMKNDNLQLSSEQSELMAVVEEKDSEITKLKSTNDDLNDENNELFEKNRSGVDTYNRINIENIKLSKEIESFQIEIQELRATIDFINQQFIERIKNVEQKHEADMDQKLQEAYAKYRAKYDTLFAAYEELQAKHKELEQTNELSQDDNNKISAMMTGLHNDLQKANAKITHYIKIIKKLQTQNKDLKARFKQTIQDLTTEISQLSNKLAATQQHFVTRLETIRVDNADEKQQLDNTYQQNIYDMQVENQRLRDEYKRTVNEAKQKNIIDCVEPLQKCKIQLQSLNKQLDNCLAKNKNLEDDVKQLQDNVVGLTKDLQTCNENKKQLVEENEQYVSNNALLQNTINDLSIKLSDCQNYTASCRAEIDSHVQSITKLKTDLDKLQHVVNINDDLRQQIKTIIDTIGMTLGTVPDIDTIQPIYDEINEIVGKIRQLNLVVTNNDDQKTDPNTLLDTISVKAEEGLRSLQASYKKNDADKIMISKIQAQVTTLNQQLQDESKINVDLEMHINQFVAAINNIMKLNPTALDLSEIYTKISELVNKVRETHNVVIKSVNDISNNTPFQLLDEIQTTSNNMKQEIDTMEQKIDDDTVTIGDLKYNLSSLEKTIGQMMHHIYAHSSSYIFKNEESIKQATKAEDGIKNLKKSYLEDLNSIENAILYINMLGSEMNMAVAPMNDENYSNNIDYNLMSAITKWRDTVTELNAVKHANAGLNAANAGLNAANVRQLQTIADLQNANQNLSAAYDKLYKKYTEEKNRVDPTPEMPVDQTPTILRGMIGRLGGKLTPTDLPSQMIYLISLHKKTSLESNELAKKFTEQPRWYKMLLVNALPKGRLTDKQLDKARNYMSEQELNKLWKSVY